MNSPSDEFERSSPAGRSSCFTMVHPFRDVLYYNCKYNPLLTALQHYAGTALPFVANSLSFIEIAETGDYMDSRVVNLYHELDVIARMGIGVRHMTGRELGEVWKATAAIDGLLYVPADLYMIPGYGNYRASHWGHWFLITDRDDSGDRVVTIEAGDGEPTNAIEKQLTIQVLSKAHQCWVEDAEHTWDAGRPDDWKDELSAIVRASPASDISHAEAVETYRTLVRNCRPKLEDALARLENEGADSCCTAMEEADYDWVMFAHRLKGLVRLRRTEAYRMCQLFGPRDEATCSVNQSATILRQLFYRALRATVVKGKAQNPDYYVHRLREMLCLERRALRALTSRE